MTGPQRRETPNIDLLDESAEGRKRLFIGLTVGTALAVCVVLSLAWLIPYVGLRALHPAAPAVLGVLVLAVLAVILWATAGLVLNVITGRNLPYFARMRGVTVKLFLPLMTLFGRALGFSKQAIRASFIKVNNELVSTGERRYRPEQMLLLMPHCLQRSTCKVRLTYDVRHCKRCGLCPIDGLLALSDRYGIDLAVATGGTIARRIVVQKRPKLILAVACERDLSAGIQDTYPLPVFGVLNERPNGPCLDTLVPLARLEAAIRRFMDPAALVEIDAKPAPEPKLPKAPKAAKSGKSEQADPASEPPAPSDAQPASAADGTPGAPPAK